MAKRRKVVWLARKEDEVDIFKAEPKKVPVRMGDWDWSGSCIDSMWIDDAKALGLLAVPEGGIRKVRITVEDVE